MPVEEIAVACTGRLQPEHLLRAFEAGSDLVCVVACAEGNCHHLEGSRRAARRVTYVEGLLGQVGADPRRLMLMHLPGSAQEDMAAGLPGAVPASSGSGASGGADLAANLAAELAARLAIPLHIPVPQAPAADVAATECTPEDPDNED
jgi:nicotinamide mononucleotide adenylyltransferase